jgi:hypothetical protein
MGNQLLPGNRTCPPAPPTQPASPARSLRFPAALLALITPALTAWGAEATADFRWNLQPDDRLQIRLTQDTQTETRVGTQSKRLVLQTALQLDARVDRVAADGTMEMTVALSRLILKTAADGEEDVRYDSAAKEPPPASLAPTVNTIRPLLNSRVVIGLSNRGEIAAVRLTGETESLLRDVPDRGRWQQLLTREGLGRMLGQALGILPAGPVQAGDTWQRRSEAEAEGRQLTVTSTYRYEGPQSHEGRTLQRICVSAQIQEPPPPGAFDAPPPPKNRSFTGTLWFDSTAGHLVESRIAHTVSWQVPFQARQIAVTASSTLTTRIARLPADSQPQ